MENKRLSIVVENGVVTLTYFDEQNSGANMQMREKYSAFPCPDDFMYACAYLIDELAKDLPIINPKPLANEPFAGRTVCIASNHSEIFKVGKIYEWQDGRTVGEDDLLHPTTGKLFSLDEITNPKLKFIKIVE